MKLMELYKDKIVGAIRGLDRVRFRGTCHCDILLKDFPRWANSVTGRIRACCESQAAAMGIEIRYLASSKQDKEAIAREIAKARGIKEGPICMLSVVEPCVAPTVQGDRASRKLVLRMRQRKCVWLYWSADETEWATDIMFRSRQDLEKLCPSLIYHAMKTSDSAAVMRFLGRWDARGSAPQEVISSYRRRHEGACVKHWKNDNSVKMYDKGGHILRIETTLNRTRDFKVYRHPNDDEKRPASWQKMRKGVSDLHRRCQISDQCNERYGDALASAHVAQTLKEVVWPACNRIKRDGKSYRGLNPWQEEDYRLVSFLSKGEHAISGFRNKDLRTWLYPGSEKADSAQHKRMAARVSRLIKLLRSHGLIKKVAKENRYTLTTKGQCFASALMSASAVDIKRLTEAAA